MRGVVLLALVGAALAAPKKSPERVVGGSPTTIDQYPYMSNMQYLYWGIWWMQCGDFPSEWRVRLGTNFASSGGSVHAVSQLVLHPNYDDDTIDNDIAIIRLSTPATLSNFVQLARIPGPNYNLVDGTVVTTIGWGALSAGGSSPEQLQHVNINIINHEICADRYAYLKTLPGFANWPDITSNMVCAGIFNVGGMDACQGDSGGPLAHQTDVIYGIVSWGRGCADSFYPGVNARVSAYTSWISSNA